MARKLSRNLAKLVRRLWLAGMTVALILAISFAPAIAQDISAAPIVIDGQELFVVENSESYSAEVRAAIVNRQIQEAILSEDPVRVEVLERNNLPTILLNNRHLLTVTETDVPRGRTQMEQAARWAQQIELSVTQAQRERTSSYLQSAFLLAGGALTIAAILHWTLGRVWRYTLSPAIRMMVPGYQESDTEAEQSKTLQILGRSVLTIARAGLWLGAIFYITNLFPLTRQWSYRIVDLLVGSLVSPLFSLGDSEYSVVALLILAALLFALVLISQTVADLLKSRVLRFTGVNQGAQEMVAILVRYSLIFLGSMVLLQLWGLDISSLAIVASALGVGIGFGLQNIAKDFGSGLVLVFERPIQVGDFIELQDFQGTVERIGARSTLIRTLDSISIIVPNSRFLDAEVINWSHGNPVSRIRLPVGVAYGSDVELVRSALVDASREHPRVLSAPPPQVFFKGFGDSALNFELLVWTAEPSKHLALKSDLYFRIETEFRRHKISIPFPQRDLHVGNLPIELSPQLQQMLQALVERSANGKPFRSDR
ncbi:mechanosensitive ion channel [Oculatella sp. LEGE 06141]|uniref:mechanosensitive ion channel family protein n=1 Tax=Oculatella sp. LEGE 06141 TaxID=1828648 RepID=UPI0018809B09|nr:mechanosensitive ion channel domain-containing protein [Oculatella sp. LEGE 06141]MBE9178056.1 mechanosensitive ion channel [Oculatella sp. LEGE 06141]